MTNNTTTQPEKPSGLSVKIIASAVVVAVIATVGVTLTVTNLVGRGAPSPAASQSAAEQTTPATDQGSPAATDESVPAGEASVCGLTDVEMTGTVTTAPTATWTLIGKIAAPSVEGAGPGVIEDDGYRSCYARTPTGALTAAANVVGMGGKAAELTQKMNERSTVPGPGREAVLAQPIEIAPDSGLRLQIAGFRLLRYDGTTADVDIAIRISTGDIASQVYTLQWVEGDWKVVLTPEGQLPTKMAMLPSLNGYIPWSGA